MDSIGSAATIVFCDVVSFSKLKTKDQEDAIFELSRVVTNVLYSCLHSPSTANKIIGLPTGDGMAIALLGDAREWEDTLFDLLYQLKEWYKKKNTESRIGVHYGGVKTILDINNRYNICGNTINMCQRIMDAAGKNQILFSESAYKEYIGRDNVYMYSWPSCLTLSQPFWSV